MLDLVIEGTRKDLGGGLEVGRVLPFARRRMVGPFIFLDHMGPADFSPGEGIDVRPHPHIGLATVTYLFDGEIHHRDSLGVSQKIRPGEVNWMTAGSGIVHSERTDPSLRSNGGLMHGMQAWVALPQQDEEVDPAFAHHGADALPELSDRGVWARLIAGSAYGLSNAVQTFSPLFYLHAEL
jgi:redox-sensitive bicupin YhaK (pirin superfamily)